MMEFYNNFLSAIKNWKSVRGYSGRDIIDNVNSLKVVEYSIEVLEKFNLSGKKILFFSDIHFGSSNFDRLMFKEKIEKIKPDWIVFGGDLITYASFQKEALEFLGFITSTSNVPKIAVYGNWDRRRRDWYPSSKWRDAYKNIGFKLLVNEVMELDGINFYGIDELRRGNGCFKKEFLNIDKLNCLLSHFVDPIVDSMKVLDVNCQKLAMAGHSHGGQIRVPFFGALLTSTKYWKLFEYGHYKAFNDNTDLIVTSGLGTTRLPLRIFCNPELVVIKFV